MSRVSSGRSSGGEEEQEKKTGGYPVSESDRCAVLPRLHQPFWLGLVCLSRHAFGEGKRTGTTRAREARSF